MAQFTVEDYYPPEWSSLPMHSYYFEIIKEGNLLGKLPIRHKSFNLIGRLEDLCDVHIDNPMVSRKHAVLQAKKDDHHLYLMDLGSQHGTFVNKTKMPAHTYKKLEPFDGLKFGVSSRVFILRCPEYEQMLEQQQNKQENEFAKMLEKQNQQLSKEQAKAKYLDMLQNDPHFAASNAPRRLTGKQQMQEEEDQYAGIDWGISDDREVYAYKNDNQMPIEPDLLRRLPLDSTQLTKLGQYQELLRRYQEVESELNELASREKRQFGLQEKLRSKKEKMEKKFVEALEALQKCEDWLRTNIFGDVSERQQKNVQAIRERQNDTFGDDDFLDRTLEKKEVKVEQKEEVPDAEVYWVLEAKLKTQMAELQAMKQKLDDMMQEKQKLIPEVHAEEDDELDLYMKQNQQQADDSNILLYQREISQLSSSISELTQKLTAIVGQQQVNKMIGNIQKGQKKTFQQSCLDKAEEEASRNKMKKMEQNKNIEDILNKLENYQQNQEDINQEDPQIFNYYKQAAQEKEQPQELDEQKVLEQLRSVKRELYDPTSFSKPLQKLRKANDHSSIPVKDNIAQNQFEEEQEVDLTKGFK